MKARTISLLALAAASLAIGGQIAVSQAASRTVTLRDIDFSPRSLSIAKGSTVTFRFRDGTTVHNVRSVGTKRFKAIGDRATGAVSRTFRSAGTYRYVCTLHPGMDGRINVR